MRITTARINGFEIDLPIGLRQVRNDPVRDSYQDFLQNDHSAVKRHLTALTTLLPLYLPNGPGKILHAFGGVGATAQVIDQCREGIEHEFWERDPVLVEYLTKKFPNSKVRAVPCSFERLAMFPTSKDGYPAGYSGLADCCFLDSLLAIMFDPSVGTIKTPLIGECWDRMAKSSAQMMWLSDTACAKIHINARFYKKDFDQEVEPTAEGYLQAYDNWLRRKFKLSVADAMREAAETYCVVNRNLDNKMHYPIKYM